MKLVDLIPSQAKLIVGVAGAVALVAVATWGYFHIYNKGWEAHVIVANAEKAKLFEANNAVIEKAYASLLSEIQIIKTEKERLEDAISRNDLEAEKDPLADTCGISADSVRRIQAIR